MEKYLQLMVRGITNNQQRISLARIHVLCLTLALPILTVISIWSVGVYMGQILDFDQVKIITLGFLFVAMQLVIIGLIAIGVRAITTRELAYAGGGKPKFAQGVSAKKAGYLILISATLLQVVVIWGILDFWV